MPPTVDEEGGASNAAHHASRPSLDAISKPGDIRINVKGAYIVDSNELQQHESSHSEDMDAGYEHDNNDIRLPNHKSVVSHIAVDIGGSLAKLVYFSHEPTSQSAGGRLNFLKFETDRIHECIEFMRHLAQKHRRLNGDSDQRMCVMATGGGAFKYYDDIKKALGAEVLREDEMECLIIGLDFFITEIPSEVFTHSPEAPMSFLPPNTHLYPYLLVNIGSGVSMIKVSGPRKFQRIGGTSLGGGTLWGLLSLITGARSFDHMLALADEGDNRAGDMLVGDIYGTNYGKNQIQGLKADTIASSFGKVYRMKREAEREAEDGGGLANGDDEPDAADFDIAEQAADGNDEADFDAAATNSHSKSPNMHPAPQRELLRRTNTNKIYFNPADISRSLLYAVSYNIGQIAYLQSCKHELEHIYFGGSFIRGHQQTMDTLSYAIRFWSNGEKNAYFLRHEGYLGAVGAFLKRQPKNWGRRNSFEGPTQAGNNNVRNDVRNSAGTEIPQ